MSELRVAFVERVGRADAEDEDGGDERPEEAFLAVAERMFLDAGRL